MNIKTVAAAAAAALLLAACGSKEKKDDAISDEVKAEICRLKDSLAPIPASLNEDGRKAAVDQAVAQLVEHARKSPSVVGKDEAVNKMVEDFKPSDKFNYLFDKLSDLFDANRLDEADIRLIVDARCPFDFVDDAVESGTKTLPAPAAGTPAIADGGFDEADMAAAEDAGIAAADQQAAYEAERLRAEAEAARARREALEAERELLAEQRRLQQQMAQQQMAQQQMAQQQMAQQQMAQQQMAQQQMAQQRAAAAPRASCPYGMTNPLRCASRDRQPAYCSWDFDACGTPQLLKQESKTTCNGKMSTDRVKGRIVVTDGCRGQFVPQS